MAKTNWSKVEESLKQGLQRMHVERLNKEAEKVNKQKKQEPEAETQDALTEEQTQYIQHLRPLLKWLAKRDKTVYGTIELAKEKADEWLAHPEKLKEEEWKQLRQALIKAEALKKKLLEEAGLSNDEELIEKERSRHITKRFNVSDKWLPLQ